MGEQEITVKAFVDPITLVPEAPSYVNPAAVAAAGGGDGVSMLFVVGFVGIMFLVLALIGVAIGLMFVKIGQSRSEAIQENNQERDQDRRDAEMKLKLSELETARRMADTLSTALAAK